MKTNENILLAHGWEKGGSNELYCWFYSKEINNQVIFIKLNERSGEYWLAPDESPYLDDVETYIAIAEELKLLNVDPDHKIINTERKDLEK